MFNLSDIKQIPIDRILSDNGYACARTGRGYTIYRSPLHDDRHPSFSVDKRRNRWHDFTLGLDGSNIDLVIRLGLAPDCGGAAKYLAMRYPSPLQEAASVHIRTPGGTFSGAKAPPVVTSVTPLRSPALRQYITEVRCIPPDIACRYLQEVHCRLPSGRDIYGAGIANRSGGYALRNQYFKMAIPPVDISLIPEHPGVRSGECVVFEGMLSFLSLVAMQGRQDCDAIVLNSVTNIHRAIDAISSYGRIRCMLDNDDAGSTSLGMIKSSFPDVELVDESWQYSGCNDLNDKLMTDIKNR